MKEILIFGAGRSSSSLIRYLCMHAGQYGWSIRVADADVELARSKTAGLQHAEVLVLDASNEIDRKAAIGRCDLVISMLPAAMHVSVARNCLEFRKSLITPSYVADDMWPLHDEAVQAGVLLLNEMGVDPGIDHMSAMQIIHALKKDGNELLSFESFTGGLVAPQSDDNPWHYKVTWNPRNVVLAGAGTMAQYLENNEVKYVPYHKLFERTTRVELSGLGAFEGYANRDSLKYRSVYGLDSIPTLIRGTLRQGLYCSAWNVLVQLGLTDDTVHLPQATQTTWSQLTASFLPGDNREPIEKRVQRYLSVPDAEMEMLRWLGIFSNEPLGISQGTPATALQKKIEQRWKLGDTDHDMIVMWHRFRYTDSTGKKRERISSLVTEGEDPIHTAMSRTVGLPIAIAAKHILSGNWHLKGIQLPVTANIYEPVLGELASMGITFTEQDHPIDA